MGLLIFRTMTYQHIPSRFLPDNIINNVAYYDGEAYQVHVDKIQEIGPYDPTNPPTTYNAVFRLTSTDAAGGTPENPTTLQGIRTVRGITVGIEAQYGLDAGAYAFFDSQLYIARSGLATIRSVLDNYSDVQNVGNQAADHIKCVLTYPGVIELHSGDQLCLLVNVRTFAPTAFQLRAGINFSYFIKYN